MVKSLDNSFQLPNNAGLCVILCTTPDDACACIIAKNLLDAHLAACITLLPGATSLYYCQKVLKQQAEVQLVIKSSMALQQTIFAHIKALHPYKTPELLVLPVIGGAPDYLTWLNNSLR